MTTSPPEASSRTSPLRRASTPGATTPAPGVEELLQRPSTGQSWTDGITGEGRIRRSATPTTPPARASGDRIRRAADGDAPAPTGLPDNLKSGLERLSGVSMGDVRVHYNSSQATQLKAVAYSQGTDIHVAPGQERHLPHEAWHVVQQKQGRVKPTLHMKGINEDPALEREADQMAAQAVSGGPSSA